MPNNAKNVRRCIVCREHADKSQLIRIVKDSEGNLVIDNDKRINGRGIYVHNTNECKQILKKKKMLSTTFKTNVLDEFYEEI